MHTSYIHRLFVTDLFLILSYVTAYTFAKLMNTTCNFVFSKNGNFKCNREIVGLLKVVMCVAG